MPVLGALGIVAAFGGSIAQGLAAGAAIAPTSLGFSSQLLSDTGLLSLPLGRLIAAAAVLDDVMSLVLLAEVQAISDDSASTWDIVFPVIGSLGAIAVGCLLVWAVNAHAGHLEQLAEAVRDVLPSSAPSTPSASQRNTAATAASQYTTSLPPSRGGSLKPSASIEATPPTQYIAPRGSWAPGSRATIAPAQQVLQLPAPASGRVDANSTMETVQLEGGVGTAVSEIVTNTSATSGVSVASRASTVQIVHHAAVPVTADASVTMQTVSPGFPVASTGNGSFSNPRTSSVRMHTITLPSDATATNSMPQTATFGTAAGTSTAAANQMTQDEAPAAERIDSAEALRTAAAVTPVARHELRPLPGGGRPALSVSDHFSTHDGMATMDSMQHGNIIPVAHTRTGDGSSDSPWNTGNDLTASSAIASQHRSQLRSGPKAPAPRLGLELQAVSSGVEGQEGEEVVTEEQLSTASAAVQNLPKGRSGEGAAGTQDQLPHPRPPPVRIREEVVTMHSEASIVLPASSSGGQESSERSLCAGGSPPVNTISLPDTPGSTLEYSVPKRASISLAVMRLSTINSESNMLTRTADSDALAAASQRALRLMSSLEEDQAISVGRVMLVALFALAVVMATACSAVRSSDLMGVFLAGLAFSGSNAVRAAWKQHVHVFVPWGSALFFACTVGFAVPPVSTLFTAGALLRGLCLLAVAVGGKLLLGLWAYPLQASNAMLLGWAMNGRGEFSFLITQQAVESGLLGEDLAGGVVWAVVLSTVVAPVGFRYVARKAGLRKRE